MSDSIWAPPSAPTQSGAEVGAPPLASLPTIATPVQVADVGAYRRHQLIAAAIGGVATIALFYAYFLPGMVAGRHSHDNVLTALVLLSPVALMLATPFIVHASVIRNGSLPSAITADAMTALTLWPALEIMLTHQGFNGVRWLFLPLTEYPLLFLALSFWFGERRAARRSTIGMPYPPH